MAIKRPKPEEIVVKLREVEVLMRQGMPQIDAIRQIIVFDGRQGQHCELCRREGISRAQQQFLFCNQCYVI